MQHELSYIFMTHFVGALIMNWIGLILFAQCLYWAQYGHDRR